MINKSGGGAATAAGIGYQDQVAAYFLVSVLVDHAPEMLGNCPIDSVSFETAHDVDDLSVTNCKGEVLHLQVKRKVTYSLQVESDLHKTLDQFVRQFRADGTKVVKYGLVTTSDSSRKVTRDLRNTLDALRSGSEDKFRRDQNATLIKILDDLLSALKLIDPKQGATLSDDEVLEMLRRVHVFQLDLASGQDMEQALIIRLGSSAYVSPELLWGKLLSDCTKHSSSHRSLTADFIKNSYSAFQAVSPEQETLSDNVGTFFDVVIPETNFPVGLEILLGRSVSGRFNVPGLDKPLPENALLMVEIRRFDDDCAHRVEIEDGRCRLANGFEMELKRRTATYSAMTRYIEANQEALVSDNLHVLEANFDDDLEVGLCADNHRRLLNEAIQRNAAITNCIQCGNPITSNGSEIIERQVDGEEIEVGLIHTGCSKSDDRIIGTIRSELFEKFPFLDGFDAEAWFKEIELGQGAFEAVKAVRSEAMMLWAGRAPTTSNRDYVVEFLLADGSSEFAYKRGQLQRFTKASAEEAIAMFEEAIKDQLEANDPLCFSDVSTTFSTRSQIIKEFGTTEIPREIRSVELRKFDLRQAKQYDFFRHWYAPITYLWLPEHEQIFAIGKSVILLTRPLEFDRHLDNWRVAGAVPPNNEFKYELKIIRDDREFDDFAEEVFADGMELLVDPLLSPGGHPEILSGTRLLSQEVIIAQHEQMT